MKDKSTSGGITFIGLLTCIFIALKLMGNITWNWFWVLSPTIIPIIIALIIFVLIGISEVLNANK